jgi:HK97 family phage portal protein
VRSPIGSLAGLVNKTPLPFSSRTSNSGLPWYRPAGTEGHLRAMGSVGTLFAIVDRLATSTAAVEWKLHRQGPPGQLPEERQEVTSHLALNIWNRPNDFYTRSLLVETGQQHFDLVGETWWVIARDPRFRTIPLELWPVVPHRIQPIPDPDNYLAGYMYTSPDGERVPLQLDEVIQIRRPNPVDMYRGIGPVQTILSDLEGVRLSAEWNRNFFANSAEPGGIVEIDRRLSDDEYDEMVARWREQHQGVANAHRVAMLEGGAKWVERKYSMRDMQFAELRSVSSDIIREAYAIDKFSLGKLDDVNRATADAAAVWFARQMTVPRLDRIKAALNTRFLPLFGATGQGVEFDYINPVDEDREADDRERDSKVAAYVALVSAGVDPGDAANAVELPRMRVTVRAPEPAPAPARDGAPAARLDVHHHSALTVGAAPTVDTLSMFDLARAHRTRPIPALQAAAEEDGEVGEPGDLDPGDLPDVGPLGDQFDAALEDLLAAWGPISAAQKAELVDQVKAAVESGDLAALNELAPPADAAEETLTGAMVAIAAGGAALAVAEAAVQAVTIDPVEPGRDALADVARVIARGMATDLALSASREALRVGADLDSDRTPLDVADAVQAHLDTLTDAQPRQRLGQALHTAQHKGRAATFEAAEKANEGKRAAPTTAYYGSERNDRNTCKPCKEIDGRWLGNSWADAERDYPTGGYERCEGRDRCRGHVVAVYRPKQVER